MVGGMAAPFVKAATASATALVAGPAGAVAGGAAGVAVDMAIGKGLELVQREDFEKEVVRAVTATREEYFRVLEASERDSFRFSCVARRSCIVWWKSGWRTPWQLQDNEILCGSLTQLDRQRAPLSKQRKLQTMDWKPAGQAITAQVTSEPQRF